MSFLMISLLKNTIKQRLQYLVVPLEIHIQSMEAFGISTKINVLEIQDPDSFQKIYILDPD